METVEGEERFGLYARLLGERWLELDGAVRRAHATSAPVKAHGSFRIEHGKSWMAPVLARLLMMPRTSEKCPVTLSVTPHGGGERWLRSFNGRPLVTYQQGCPDGLLDERFVGLQLRFRLRVENRALYYDQVAARLSFGPLRILLPALLSPQVEASETAASADSTDVIVSVTLPGVGPLIEYRGRITVEESSPC